MKNTKKTQLLIIGSGPAGYTAAIYAVRANLNPILVTGNNIGGQLTKTSNIENWPGNFPKITGQKLMDNLHNHTVFLNTNIINDTITKIINFKKTPFIVEGNIHTYVCNSIIIATGSNPKFLGLNSEKKFIGKGVSSCAICDGFFFRNKIVSVIGGGNTAIEEAIYLSNIASEVHLIHRKNIFNAEKILLNKLKFLVEKKKIFLHIPYVLKEILGDEKGVNSININSINNNKNVINILTFGVFILIGTTPNSNLFKKYLKLDKNGYITINNDNLNNLNYTQTSIPGIFAAGDVIDKNYRQAITSSATGCMAALDAQKFLSKINK
ncbi:thioredoxin-disulfide reductase [Enterobacteriaceae endosymbiont of Donacia cincticornis]|uniref:thioredoxin-disulfide reductase n=1 Tax=Enterobacteriaceae endosymbiont of Donacia cincticornis TaxID=2675773 RepID=UPI00144A10FB|nr:thioredoxin-disulfide reductase [Enterobacteriaceae endosymbiont of Donacia cincticornis]QJC36297.1 thioredoxin-disulfide reductase [Enterobacteriaceae endosymbiont of Donacia cincticornis]